MDKLKRYTVVMKGTHLTVELQPSSEGRYCFAEDALAIIAERDAEIKQLRADLDCRDNQLQTVTRTEETETEIIVYGDPGEHNCDQMGCSSIEHVLVIIKKP